MAQIVVKGFVAKEVEIKALIDLNAEEIIMLEKAYLSAKEFTEGENNEK